MFRRHRSLFDHVVKNKYPGIYRNDPGYFMLIGYTAVTLAALNQSAKRHIKNSPTGQKMRRNRIITHVFSSHF